jgi:hypothetical protein
METQLKLRTKTEAKLKQLEREHGFFVGVVSTKGKGIELLFQDNNLLTYVTFIGGEVVRKRLVIIPNNEV